VSPSTYSGASAQRVVEARASAVTASGAPAKASVEWKVSDPEMVTVSPTRGDQVKITVKRVGESTVTVKSGAASRKLTITAAEPKGIWQVSIIQ
jgi:hypothetical protein